ncbi:AlpA family phage regulatory protein [uncultured Shimia sp.]|uniref:helix-turn-helix transcriptional regulator n=1 Tax=uncultured Shimia sp. TaxID=573152 RepID=UPI002605C85E|nr:AlpA family phage regulatory protein [uncultured Shimia sp.]
MLEKHYRRPEVESLTGLSTSSIYRLMDEGCFPRPIKIGRSAVAWPESVLAKWLQERQAA